MTKKKSATANGCAEEDIVISGISGRFPECNSVNEFQEKLFTGVDLVTIDDRRWPPGLYGLPPRSGKLKDIKHFDANFFGLTAKHANVMDPQIRILLETTFEAILDAGVNPMELRGSKVGVFVGASISESLGFAKHDAGKGDAYSLIGGCTSMFSSRISYNFDFKGPSLTINTACSSSLVALQKAVAAIRAGECEAAIIGGSSLLLDPTASLFFYQLNMLSVEGKCKSFDASGVGYIRSEAIASIFIQKASKARRIYATILGTKVNNDGYKEEGITYPSRTMQGNLAQEILDELCINPQDVQYVEAHGTGTKAGDPPEVNGIADVFCKGRKKPLLIGSVKSNMGHSEPASGLCSITKVIIAMESGAIPGNLHYENPNTDIPALVDGRLKVVIGKEPWNGGLVAVNSFGFGGTNAHVILRSNPKPKIVRHTQYIHRLVTVSGRTEAAVQNLLQKIEKYESDFEFLGLLDKIHSSNIPGHPYRGYSILGFNQKEVSQIEGKRRPIWFVYSGTGSQYPGIARQMLEIDIFKNSIMEMTGYLLPHGVNIMDLLVNGTETLLNNVINMFVSIVAVQIALTDVLRALGIEPDGIIGHSIGELGCAYADGSLTSEQVIKIAYARGRAILDSSVEPGAMAAVDLTWEECKQRCGPDVFPACHNSKNNVSVSGSVDAVEALVKQLQHENVSAKVINSAGQAFHSKYIAAAGPKYKKALDGVIDNPKLRSSRWVSSSIPEEEWNTPLSMRCSAEYHLNNFLSPVLFYKVLQHVPENAIVIELAPHGLLQSAIKESMTLASTYCSLMKRGDVDNVEYFLNSVGRLYNSGAQPNISQLYPPVQFPVGRGTPAISSLVE